MYSQRPRKKLFLRSQRMKRMKRTIQSIHQRRVMENQTIMPMNHRNTTDLKMNPYQKKSKLEIIEAKLSEDCYICIFVNSF